MDFFHATQHLWQVGTALFGTGTPEASAWVEPLKDRLSTQGAPAVLTALETLTPTSAAAEEVVRLAQGYFTTHSARMDYPAFVARQLPIDSGAVESTCTTLFAARAKGAGMRWSRLGLQAVLSLRAVERSARWTSFWRAQPQRHRLPLCPHARAHRRAASRAVVPLPLPPPGGPSPRPMLPLLLRPPRQSVPPLPPLRRARANLRPITSGAAPPSAAPAPPDPAHFFAPLP